MQLYSASTFSKEATAFCDNDNSTEAEALCNKLLSLNLFQKGSAFRDYDNSTEVEVLRIEFPKPQPSPKWQLNSSTKKRF